jgi:hypothetical protein
MALKTIPKITNKQIAEKGVQALADRPNLSAQYGASGLSAKQLKLWFDNLATFLAERINEISGTISSNEAANYIRVCLDDYDIDNLGTLIQSFTNGEFAKKILQVYPSVAATKTEALQTTINNFAKIISDFKAILESGLAEATISEIRHIGWDDEEGKKYEFVFKDGRTLPITAPKGDSGVTIPADGFFSLAVDANGDLWAYFSAEGTTYDFEYNEETGALHLLQTVDYEVTGEGTIIEPTYSKREMDSILDKTVGDINAVLDDINGEVL